jgi:hypothetical protein
VAIVGTGVSRRPVGTGVSRQPKENCGNASFLHYSFCRKRNNMPKPSTAQAG